MPSDDKTIIADSIGSFGLQVPSKKKQACLIQYSGSNLGKRFNIENIEVNIGRLPTSGICVNEQSVSKQHARLVQAGETYTVEDLKSTNGTFINDEKVESPTQLRNEDMLRLGAVLFKYYSHQSIDNVFADQIYGMATIDGGTNIFNKKYLMEELDHQFKLAKGHAGKLSLVYYDLDHFKKVNDEHGHNAGDFILKESAALVTAIVRKDDIYARFGGEEFVLILPNTELKIAVDLAERIRSEIEVHVFRFDGKDIKQKVSLGVVLMNDSHLDPKMLLDDADKKLYVSKDTGRNKVTY